MKALSIILNDNPLLQLYAGFGLSFLLALCITPLMQRIASMTKCVALPKQDRWHSQPTPLLGGLAIFIAFLIPSVLFLRESKTFGIVLLGSLLSVGLGILDDLLHTKPSTKLIGQIIIACLTIGLGLKFGSGISPLVGIPLTIFWIVGIMNALNLLDNMDGLAGGTALISALALGGSALMEGRTDVALFMSFLVGAVLAFLRYNFSPAKIFMGDSGSMLLGYLLSTGAILESNGSVSNLLMTLAVPVLILSVPIFDTTFVTLVRKLNHRPVSQGGRDHLSHRLVAFGLSERKAVLTLYGVSLFFGALSFLSFRLNLAVMMVFTGLAVLALFLFGMFLGEVKVYTEEEQLKTNGKKKEWIFLNGVLYHKRRAVEVLVDLSVICLSYVAAFLLRFEGVISPENLKLILESLPIVIAMKLLSFFFFGLYRGVWRYISLNDLASIFKAVLVGQVASVLFLVGLFRFEGYSRTLFVIDGILLFLLVSGSRVLLRLFREFFISLGERGKRILIMGAGDAGEFALREIRNNHGLNYKPVGFIDDNSKKKGNRIHGIPVLGTRHQLIDVARRERAQEVLIAIPSVPDERFADVYENCRQNNILCHRMPFVITAPKGQTDHESDVPKKVRNSCLYLTYDGLLDPLGQSQVLPYVERLSKMGVPLTLVSFEKKKSLLWNKKSFYRQSLAEQGIQWVPLSYHKWPPVASTVFDVLQGGAVCTFLCRRSGFEIVHARSYVAALIALWVKRITGARFLFDMRGFWPEERVEGDLSRSGGLLYRCTKWWERRFFEAADGIVVLSAVAKELLESRFGKEGYFLPPITVIPTCTDLKKFVPIEKRGDLPLSRIVYLGSVGTWYLMKEMVQFFKVLHERTPAARLTVLTPRPDPLVLHLLKDLDPSLYEVQMLPHEEVPKVLQTMHASVCFIKPVGSKKASCPTKVGESLACGVPVVITRGVGDCDRLIEAKRVGVVISAHSPETYRDAVEQLVQLVQEGPSLTERCRRVAEDYFDVDRGAEKYLSCYEEVLKRDV